MKTYNNLYNQICSQENLYKAYLKARKGKRYNKEVMAFTANLEQNLATLQSELMHQTYTHGSYREFMVSDSKKRLIKAAPFRDRVVHHAIYAVVEPIFDKSFIYHSYACRKGKGTHLAVKNLRRMTKSSKAKYCLQCDISKYFDSIDHGVLLQMLSDKLADQKTLDLLKLVLDSTFAKVLPNGQKAGIPIGNLTSQLFANIYLTRLDQFIKHDMHQKLYIRYMDDFLILGPAKELLHTTKERIRDFVQTSLRLLLHPKKAVVYPVSVGVDFLGYVLKEKVTLVRKSTVRRFVTRMAQYKKLVDAGFMARNKYGAGVRCFMNYTSYANAWNLRVALCRVLMVAGFILGAGVFSLAYSQKAYAGYETAKFNQGYNTGGAFYLDAGNIGAGVQTVSFWLSGTTGGNIMDFNGTQYVAISGAGAITLTGITGTVYVDGVVSSTVPDSNWHFVVITTATDITASAVKFGSLEMGNFDGTLDEVKFYSYALSAREVAEKYRQGSPTMALGGTINGDLRLVGDAYFTEDLHLTGALYDTSDSAGTDGQYLKSTATGTAWISFNPGVDILPTGTEGQMLYNNAGVWTAFSDMYWKDSSGSLGIGTTSPAYKLDIAGTLGVGSTAYFASLVGIGTTVPSEELEIVGDIKLSGASPKIVSTTGLDLDLGDAAGSYSFDIRDSGETNLLSLDSLGNLTLNGQTGSSATFNLIPSGTTDAFTINRSGAGTGFAFRVNDAGAGDTSPFVITSAGDVGIGTTNPTYQLQTTGTLGVGSTAYFASLVGIGTTAPGYSLEVSGGDIYTSGDLRVAGDDIFMATNTANYFLMADGTNYNPTSPADARTGLGLVAGGTGDIWVEKAGDTMTGNLTFNKADSSIIFDTLTATDTDFWLGVQDDAGGDDDDLFMIGDGATPGTNSFLTINSSGYVGIGTTAPVALLEVMGATNQLQLSYDASNYNIWSVASDGTLTHNNNGTNIATYNTAGISFKTPTSFDTAGDVSMAYNLVMSNPVSSGITFEGAGTISTSHPSANYNLTLTAANSGVVVVDDAMQVTGRITMDTWTADGDTAVYKNASGQLGLTSSDARLKKNLEQIADPLEKIMGLTGYLYNPIEEADGTKKRLGLIAQDLLSVGLPEATYKFTDASGSEYYGIHYEKLTALLVEGLKAENARVDGLYSRTSNIDALQTQVDYITSLLGLDALESSESSSSSAGSSDSSFLSSSLGSNLLAGLQTLYDNFVQMVEALGLKQVDGELVIESPMSVLGDASFADVTISGDLSLGLLKVDSAQNSISITGPACYNIETDTLNEELCNEQTIYLQKNLAGKLDLFDGGIVFSPDGSLTAKSVSAEQVTSQVYGVNSTSQSVGEGIIPVGETDIVISSTSATGDYKVFVTATSNTQGVDLFVKDKGEGTFTVATSDTTGLDIKFDWWVVVVE